MGMESTSLDFNFRTSRPDNFHDLFLTDTKISAKPKVSSLISFSSQNDDTLQTFCDSSFSSDKGGADAAFCPRFNTLISLRAPANAVISNHECELLGLLAATHLAVQTYSTSPFLRLFIFVDNQGVIRRMHDPGAPKTGQVLISYITDLLRSLPKDVQVTFVWCPGHMDIHGNEVADKLTREAIDCPLTPIIPVEHSAPKIRRLLMEPHKQLKKESDLRIGLSALILPLLSGHCPLHAYLFRVKRRTDPLGDFCGCRETVAHFMNDCPRYRDTRNSLRKAPRTAKISFRSNQLDLSLHHPKARPAIAHFLLDSGRFEKELSGCLL